MKLNIALIQTDLSFGCLDRNMRKLESLIRAAAEDGANLICLPESCNIGYRESEVALMAEELSEDIDGLTITRMRQLAAELNVHLVVPLFLWVKDGCENTAVLISDTGDVIGTYAKTHLTASEKLYLRAGNQYPVFDTKLGKVGLLICNDVGFPEAARMLGVQGAEIIVLPAAWAYFKEVPFWWSTMVRARAMENATLVAAVNRVGTAWDDGTPFCGESTVIGPSGAILEAMDCSVDGYSIHSSSLEIIRSSKASYNYLVSERKPSDYGLLCI